jgi:hypothetical protein
MLPFEVMGQGTPRAALRTFVRAAESGRFDVLLRLVPSRFRTSVTADKLRAFWQGEAAAPARAMLRELRLNLDARIYEEGDEAYMPYGARRQARFVREDGVWKLESPE